MSEKKETTAEGGEDLAAIVAELRADLDAERAEKNKVIEKNRELVGEKQAAKQAAREAEAEKEAEALKAAERNGDIEALKSAHEKELKKLQEQVTSRDTQLRTLLVDGEITRAYSASGRPELSEQFSVWLKSKVDEDYKDGVATIEGKPIAEFVNNYLSSDAGSNFRRPPDNSGSNATGATTMPPAQHGFTKENFDQKKGEWLMLSGSNPTLAKQIAHDVGRAKLAEGL